MVHVDRMYAICFNPTVIISIILFTGPMQHSKYMSHIYLQIIKAGSAKLFSKSERRKKNKPSFR